MIIGLITRVLFGYFSKPEENGYKAVGRVDFLKFFIHYILFDCIKDLKRLLHTNFGVAFLQMVE